MTSKEFVKKEKTEYILKEIQEYVRQVNCEHDWVSHGFGYECKNCHLYTGLNTDLNNLIQKGLASIKKNKKELLATNPTMPETCNECPVHKKCFFSKNSMGCYSRLWKFLVMEKI